MPTERPCFYRTGPSRTICRIASLLPEGVRCGDPSILNECARAYSEETPVKDRGEAVRRDMNHARAEYQADRANTKGAK